ncbi:MAG TPA: HlyD family secretion protein [Kofleriaceae bacterium]|jgi:membrane fusion protein (multidrug efflux system)|nr:HlyD family secretion protein [Kofleriaceae bacterium]
MEAPSTPSPPKKKKAPLVLGVLLVVAAIVGGIIYITRLGKEKTDDAQVEGHVATVSARVAGQVKRVAIDDNQMVKKGDVLVELDDRDQQVRVLSARADLAAAQAQLRQAQTQLAMTDKTAKANLAVAKGGVAQAAAVTGSTQAMIDQAKADVSAAESRKQLTKLDRDRYERMLAGGAVAKAEVDARVAADTQADAQLATAKARLVTAMANRSNSSGTAESAEGKLLAASTVDEQLQSAQAQVALNEARVAQSQSALDRALLELEYTKVKAEIDGTIARRSVEPGQMVGPDRPLAAIVDLADTWVIANLKETQLEDIKAGQTVDISVDTYGGDLHGKVDSIAAGTGSRFSLLPPDNASGNFIKVTQRVPVKIKLDDRAGKILRPGMSADVTIHTK